MPNIRISKFFISLLIILSPLIVRVAYTCSSAGSYVPVYLPYEVFRAPVRAEEPRNLRLGNSIFIYQTYLFIVDKAEGGVHVYDNGDPSFPIALSFIPIIDTSEMVVSEGILYAKSYVDLVLIDIRDPVNAVEINRLTDVFSKPIDQYFYRWGEEPDETQGLVIDGEYVYDSTSNCGVDSDTNFGGCAPRLNFGGGGGSSYASENSLNNQVSISGSLAAMLVIDDFIYVLDGDHIVTLSITDGGFPELLSEVETVSGAETIYYHEGSLFLGTTTGVRIYSLENPYTPSFAGLFEHRWQCDPVVVEGTIAYSTLRGGCGWSSRLDILDVSDITAPSLINSVEFEDLHGLAIEDGILFLANGYFGLDILDVSDPLSVEFIYDGLLTLESEILRLDGEFIVRDIILNDSRAVILGWAGVIQFDYSEMQNLELLSEIRAYH